MAESAALRDARVDRRRRRHRRAGQRAAAGAARCPGHAARGRGRARRQDAPGAGRWPAHRRRPHRVHDALGVRRSILQQAGSSLEALVGLEPLSVLARHAWKRRRRRAAAARPARRPAGFGRRDRRVSPGPHKARRYLAFCAEARRVYQRLEGPHIRAARPSLAGMIRELGARRAGHARGLGPFATLWTRLGHHFPDPRLRQLFGRYATYCGASPLAGAGHADADRPCRTRTACGRCAAGCMRCRARWPNWPASAARRCASTQRVERIVVRDGRARGVRLADGERDQRRCGGLQWRRRRAGRWACSAPMRAVPRAPCRVARRSLSALTWAHACAQQRLRAVAPQRLLRRRLRAEFDDVFRRGRLPQRGTVYVCAQDRDSTTRLRRAAASGCCAWSTRPPDGDRAPLRCFGDRTMPATMPAR